MTTTDRHGQRVTAADPAQVERYDLAVDSLLRFSDTVMPDWGGIAGEAGGMPLADIGIAYLCCLSSEGPDAAEARKILDGLGDGAGLVERERRHLSAARAYAEGDLHGASDQLAAISAEHPQDALALVVGHQLDFFRGDSTSLRDRVARAMPAWDPTSERYGFLLGMHAFGLEESGSYDEAEAAGLEALQRDRRDVWALHAVAHTHEMRGQVHAGKALMEQRRADWTTGNFFVVHNAWHEALFFLDSGDTTTPLRIYDEAIHNDASEGIALEMIDASALLWRLHLDGIDTGGRWSVLADSWAAKTDAPWYVFNDVHAVMALVGAGRSGDAEHLIDELAAWAAAGGGSAKVANLAMTAEVGLPVARAMVAFGAERYDEVIDLLMPISGFLNRFGGSHAQRDAFARTLLEAAIRSGRLELADELVAQRLSVRDSNPYGWRQLAKLRRAEGNEDAGSSAAAEAARRSVPTPA